MPPYSTSHAGIHNFITQIMMVAITMGIQEYRKTPMVNADVKSTGWKGCIQPPMSLSLGLSSKMNMILEDPFDICIFKISFMLPTKYYVGSRDEILFASN